MRMTSWQASLYTLSLLRICKAEPWACWFNLVPKSTVMLVHSGPVQWIFRHAFPFYLHYRICPGSQNGQPERSGSLCSFSCPIIFTGQVHKCMFHKEPGGIGRVLVLASKWNLCGFTCFAVPFPPPCPFPSGLWHFLLCWPFPYHPYSPSSPCCCQWSGLGFAMPFILQSWCAQYRQPDEYYKHRFWTARRGTKLMWYCFGGRGSLVCFIYCKFVNTWIVNCAYEIHMQRPRRIPVNCKHVPLQPTLSAVLLSFHRVVFARSSAVRRHNLRTAHVDPFLDVRFDIPSSFMLYLSLWECSTVSHSHTII